MIPMLAVSQWVLMPVTVLFVLVCVVMVLTVLIQRPQGGGLTSAFGGAGAGSGQTAFGTKTGDALTWLTIIIFATYVVIAIGLNFATRSFVAGGQAAPAVESGTDTGAPAPTPPAGTETPSPTGVPPATPAATPQPAPAAQPSPQPAGEPGTAPSETPAAPKR